MANYFVKEGNVLQMRPVVPVGFRRVVRAEKAETAGGECGDGSPCPPPIEGLPPSRRRSFRPLIALVIFGWALFIGLGMLVRWAVN